MPRKTIDPAFASLVALLSCVILGRSRVAADGITAAIAAENGVADADIGGDYRERRASFLSNLKRQSNGGGSRLLSRRNTNGGVAMVESDFFRAMTEEDAAAKGDEVGEGAPPSDVDRWAALADVLKGDHIETDGDGVDEVDTESSRFINADDASDRDNMFNEESKKKNKKKQKKKKKKQKKKKKKAKGDKSSKSSKAKQTNAPSSMSFVSKAPSSSPMRKPTPPPTSKPTDGGSSPTPFPSLKPVTTSPTTPGPSTASPTTVEPGAIYQTSFERGFAQPVQPEWTTAGTAGVWERTSEEAASGVFSVRSPDLKNDAFTRVVSNVTLQTNPSWGAGALYFSAKTRTLMPYDNFLFYVDGIQRGRGAINPDEFEERGIQLSPGPHTVTWSYQYNPNELPPDVVPPDPVNRPAVVYLDDVYFVPDKVTTVAPTVEPTISHAPTATCVQLDPNPDTFEAAPFPTPPWSVSGDGDWALDLFNGGTALKSPDLEGSTGAAVANATLQVCPDWEGGRLRFQIFATVQAPNDIFYLFIDDNARPSVSIGSPTSSQSWMEIELAVSPGPHRLNFSYQYYRFGTPPMSAGAVWIDNVELAESTLPTLPPTMEPTLTGPTTTAPTLVPAGANYYIGFEQATYPSNPEWSTSGWYLTKTLANSGVYSIQSPDLTNENNTPNGSETTLMVNVESTSGGKLYFSVYQGVELPFDDFSYFVDQQYFGGSDSAGNVQAFVEVEVPLGPGMHEITFIYRFNPNSLEVLPPTRPDGTAGVVYLDDVYVIDGDEDTPPTAHPTSDAPVTFRPSTVAPTSTPPASIYYQSFERFGSIARYPEWDSVGDDALWERTSEFSASGVFSFRSPDLSSDELTPKVSNITFTTNPQWPSGRIHYSAYTAVERPFDNFQLLVDGLLRRDGGFDVEGFVDDYITLSPGPHSITWSYSYNPFGLSAFPPEQPGRIGAIFLDDVFFVPDEAIPPTPKPTHSNPPVSEVPSTQAPTSIPPGSDYYTSFERGFLKLGLDPEWSTTGDGLWERTNEEAVNGVYSIRSPALKNGEFARSGSNVTLTTNPNWGVGKLYFSAFTKTVMPFDDFFIYLNGDLFFRGQINSEGFEEQSIPLPVTPGPHEVSFGYIYNPQDFSKDKVPEDPEGRPAAVYLDDIYFLPNDALTPPPTPTPPPTMSSAPTPLCVPLDPNPETFEDGMFPSSSWSTGGAGDWALATDNAYNNSEISLKSPDLEGMGYSISNATIQTCAGFTGGVLTFEALASVDPPHDILFIHIDGEEAASLLDVTEWTAVQLSLTPGFHRIDFSYQYNIFGVDPLPPSPPQRQGAVWIDNVQIITA